MPKASKKKAAGGQTEPSKDQIEAVVGSGQHGKYIPEGFHRFSNYRHKRHTYMLKCLSYWEHIPIYQAEYLVLEEFFKNHKVKDMPAPPQDGKLPKGFKNLD